MSDDLGLDGQVPPQKKKRNWVKIIIIIVAIVIGVPVIAGMALAGFQASLFNSQNAPPSSAPITNNPLPVKSWMANDNDTNNNLDSLAYTLLYECQNVSDSSHQTCITAIKTMQTKCIYGELRACENKDFQALLQSDMKAYNLA